MVHKHVESNFTWLIYRYNKKFTHRERLKKDEKTKNCRKRSQKNWPNDLILDPEEKEALLKSLEKQRKKKKKKEKANKLKLKEEIKKELEKTKIKKEVKVEPEIDLKPEIDSDSE